MKKILALFFVIIFLLIGTLAACDEGPELIEAPPLVEEEHPPDETPTSELTPQATPEPIDEETAVVGVIRGDVLYKDIEISRLYVEPFIYILGSPLSERGAFFYYEGLGIVSSLLYYGAEPCLRVAIQLDAFEPYLNLFELNGVTLNMTRTEVIAIFGAPYSAFDCSLTYHISSYAIDYALSFGFDAEERVSGITMARQTGMR